MPRARLCGMYYPPMPVDIVTFLNQEDARAKPAPAPIAPATPSLVVLPPHVRDHASPLVMLILESWPAMIARFHLEAEEGLSVKQVEKHLGDLAYNGRHRPRDFREPRGLPIAKALGWLKRRRLLKSSDVGGRQRFVRVERID